ncbi:MAG: hypothetical protein PVF91_13310 [Chromatiales bacterium]|jgi:hypothetical protein
MTAVALRHWRRDAPLGLLLGAVLLGMVGFLAGPGVDGTAEVVQGWRRIDTQALIERIGSGELQRTEARWYRVVPEGGGASPEGTGP